MALNHNKFGGSETVEIGDGTGAGIGCDVFDIDNVIDIELGDFFIEGEGIKGITSRTGQSAEEFLAAAKRFEFIFAMVKNHA